MACYALKHLFKEITERCTSLAAACATQVVEHPAFGLKMLQYSRMQNMWDPAGDMSPS